MSWQSFVMTAQINRTPTTHGSLYNEIFLDTIVIIILGLFSSLFEMFSHHTRECIEEQFKGSTIVYRGMVLVLHLVNYGLNILNNPLRIHRICESKFFPLRSEMKPDVPLTE
jgi:hypothetical protein